MVATNSKRCTCRAFSGLIFQVCFIAAFVLCIVGLTYQQFYYEKGEAFSGRILAHVNYDFDEFTYSYKLHVHDHTYVNYTMTMGYDDVYDIFCADYDPQPDFCSNLKHISGNDFQQFLSYCIYGGMVVSWIIFVFASFWNFCCLCKCGAPECQKGLVIAYYFIELLASITCVLGYGLFFYLFNKNFNKAKGGFDEIMSELIPIENINWDKIEIGKSNYFVGSGILCSFISLSVMVVFTIRLCFSSGGGVADLTGEGDKNKNTNNNQDNPRGLLMNDKKDTSPYTIVVNN